MKKYLAIIMSVVLAFTLIPSLFSAHALNSVLTVGYAMGEYDTLAQAVTAATDGDIIQLLEDVTATGLTLNKSMTIDTNGYVWTGGTSSKANCASISGAIEITIENSKRTTQVSTDTSVDIICNSTKNGGVFGLGDKATLNMVNIVAKSTNAYSNNQPCIVLLSNKTTGVFNLNNCYFTSDSYGAIGVSSASAPQINAMNSIFSGNVCSVFLINAVAATNSNLSFENCTFNKPITAVDSSTASGVDNSTYSYTNVYYNFKNCTATSLFANNSTAIFSSTNAFAKVYSTITVNGTSGTSLYSDAAYTTAINMNEALALTTPVYSKEAPAAYAVTIDGTKYADVPAGETYKLPAGTVKGFIAYNDGNNYYAADQTINVNRNIFLTSVSVGEVSMLYGASMRLTEKSGIRFYTKVDTDKIAALKAVGATIEMGTLIAPENLLNNQALTLNINESNRLNVEYLIGVEKGQWYEESLNGVSFKGMVGSIVNIRTSTETEKGNENRRFVGRGYVTVSIGNITKTIYADYFNNDIKNSTRSVSFIANALRNNASEYNSLTDKTVVDYFADAYNIADEY